MVDVALFITFKTNTHTHTVKEKNVVLSPKLYFQDEIIEILKNKSLPLELIKNFNYVYTILPSNVLFLANSANKTSEFGVPSILCDDNICALGGSPTDKPLVCSNNDIITTQSQLTT